MGVFTFKASSSPSGNVPFLTFPEFGAAPPAPPPAPPPPSLLFCLLLCPSSAELDTHQPFHRSQERHGVYPLVPLKCCMPSVFFLFLWWDLWGNAATTVHLLLLKIMSKIVRLQNAPPPGLRHARTVTWEGASAQGARFSFPHPSSPPFPSPSFFLSAFGSGSLLSHILGVPRTSVPLRSSQQPLHVTLVLLLGRGCPTSGTSLPAFPFEDTG